MTENREKGTITHLSGINHPLHYDPFYESFAARAKICSSQRSLIIRERMLCSPGRRMRRSSPSI